MHHVFKVFRHEIATTIARRSFWLTTFLFPLVIMAFSLAPQFLAERALDEETASLTTGANGASRPVGYVDESGLIAALPADLAGLLQAYPDRQAAAEALQAGAIGRYFIFPPRLVQDGRVTVVADSVSPIAGGQSEDLLRRLVAFNLVGSELLTSLVLAPTAGAEVEVLAPAEVDNRASPAGFGISFVLMFILFFTITLSSGYMLQSVVKEKENRTAEVLLTSLSPLELMAGKVAGLGVVALAQMAVWLGGGMLLFNQGETLLAGLGGVTLPAGFAVLLVVYFLLGYLVYSSALGALGALAPNVREGSQFTFIMILPLLIPLWFNSVLLQDPNGLPATLLSLFPLTAPTAMVTRLAITSVPGWQIALGVVLLALTAAGFVVLSARFFRADTLLSDASLNWRRLRGELRAAGRTE